MSRALKILLAEDNPVILQLFAAHFEKWGFPFSAASYEVLNRIAQGSGSSCDCAALIKLGQHDLHVVTSKDAVDKTVMRHTIDIAVLDHNLKGGSSFDAARILLVQTPLPVMVLIGQDSKGQLEELCNYSAELLRPMETRGLIRRVKDKYVSNAMDHIMSVLGAPKKTDRRKTCHSLRLIKAES